MKFQTIRSRSSREIRYLECGDRDTEIRTIAREVKRLVLTENYDLSEIALVVRERATYGPTITRVMLEESLPCNLELRIDAGDVPANRAALKLLSLLEGLSADEDADDADRGSCGPDQVGILPAKRRRDARRFGTL